MSAEAVMPESAVRHGIFRSRNDSLADEARLAGFRHNTSISLRAVERRRDELLMLVVIVGVAAVVALMLITVNGHRLSATYTGGAVALRFAPGLLIVALTVYLVDKELHLRRLTRMLFAQEVELVELSREARTDSLTRLETRRSFTARLERCFEQGEAATAAVAFIDLDNFKAVNDQFGHDTGDAVLTAVAQRLHRELWATGAVARFGGDEFIILLEALGSQESALVTAERVHSLFEPPVVLSSGELVVVTASIGVAFGSDADSAPDLIRKADLAMYCAKAAGPQGTRRFDSELRDLLRTGHGQSERSMHVDDRTISPALESAPISRSVTGDRPESRVSRAT